MSDLRVLRRDDLPSNGCDHPPAWKSTDLGPRAIPCACGGSASTEHGDANDVSRAKEAMAAKNFAASRGPIGVTLANFRR